MWVGTETEISFETELNLCLIRHGITKSNSEYRYLGKTDEKLSDVGIRDLRDRKEKGMYELPENVFSGPMLRCRQTAEILFPKIKYKCIPEWTEIDFGSFEGKNHSELDGNEAYQKWIDSNGMLPFPEGESRDAYIERTMCGFDRMIRVLKVMGQIESKITAIVHGGTIMAICSRLFGGDYFDYQVKCGEGFVCRFRYMSNGLVDIMEIKKIC